MSHYVPSPTTRARRATWPVTTCQPPAQPPWCGPARLPELTLQGDKSLETRGHGEGRENGRREKIKKVLLVFVFKATDENQI